MNQECNQDVRKPENEGGIDKVMLPFSRSNVLLVVAVGIIVLTLVALPHQTHAHTAQHDRVQPQQQEATPTRKPVHLRSIFGGTIQRFYAPAYEATPVLAMEEEYAQGMESTALPVEPTPMYATAITLPTTTRPGQSGSEATTEGMHPFPVATSTSAQRPDPRLLLAPNIFRP